MKSFISPKSFPLLIGVLFLIGASVLPISNLYGQGLVAYYPFDGNANDQEGMLDGTPTNGASLTMDRFSNPNSAYVFDGIDDYIEFASPAITETDNFTMSAWVNPAAIPQEGMAVSHGFDNCGYGNGYSMGMGAPFSSGNGFEGLIDGVIFAPSGTDFTSVNEWYHIVMLRDNGITKMYLNGVQTPNTYGQSPYVPTHFRIGGQNGCRFWNGKVDDVRIYSIALQPAEVAALYEDESSPQDGCKSNCRI